MFARPARYFLRWTKMQGNLAEKSESRCPRGFFKFGFVPILTYYHSESSDAANELVQD